MSPLIVRTVAIPSGLSLSALNRVLLACFGWSGECLHEFEIRARRYSDEWIVDAQSSVDVTIGSLGLRLGERFCWRYDFIAGWRIACRVEALIDDVDAVTCLDGRRVGPPEWCGGPTGFYRWEDSFSIFDFLDAVDGVLLKTDPNGGDRSDGDTDDRDVGDLMCRLRELSQWMLRDRFDKAEVNGRLSMLEVPSCVSLSRSA